MLLKDLFDFLPKTSRPASFGKTTGLYPFFSSSNTIDKFSDVADFNGEYLIIGDGGTGNCKYINGEFSASDHNYILKPKPGTNCQLIKEFLSKDNFKILNDGFKGVGIKNVSKTYIQNINFKMNPKYGCDEMLKNLTSIETAIEKKNDELKLYDELIKSRFIEMFGDPISNPKHYPIKKIEQLFDVGSSKRVFESEWTDSGVPFYRAREIVKLSQDGFVDNELFITEEMFGRYKNKYGVPKANDMMVTGVGTLGVCYIVKESDRFYFKDGNILWFKNKGVCDVRFIKDQYDTDFVKEQINRNANASTVGTYTITNAKNTLVLVPPIEEQNKYIEFIKRIDKSKLICQKQIKLLNDLLNKKLDEYFGG